MTTVASSRKYLITGGSSGLGRACARHLTAEGAQVWITGARDATVSDTIAAGDAAGGTVCDIADRSNVFDAFDEALAHLGSLDGAFLNAGIDAGDDDPEQLRHVRDISVLGTFHCTQAAHRSVARPGTVVINASVAGVSTAAVASLAQSLAIEWSAENLAVIAISPGYYPSNMTAPDLNDLAGHIPAPRLGEPDEIGATVSFLLSGAAPFLTGANITFAGVRNV